MGYYRQQGFTLIEVVMIIVIIAIMSTVAIRSMQPITERTREEGTMREMDLLAEAICGDKDVVVEGIRADYGYVGDVGSLPPDLDALVTNSGGYSTWKGPYIRSAFNESPEDYKRDAWNQLYSYTGGVKIISTGGGDTLTKQFAQSVGDLTSNTVTGNVYDGLGAGPGSDDTLVTVTIFYPDGSGEVASSSTNPSAAGAFSFTNSIPIGNHLVRAVYSTANDTAAIYVSVTPKSDAYCELHFPGSIW
jgi:prepilin-type N-terminal cleavage/methylation domain-containing protein